MWIKTVAGPGSGPNLINLNHVISVKVQPSDSGSDDKWYIWAHGDMVHKGPKEECRWLVDTIAEVLEKQKPVVFDVEVYLRIRADRG